MNITNATTFVHAQLTDLLLSLKDNEYNQPLVICNGSSIGMHVRHIIESYQSLLRDLPSGTVDYNNRARNQLLETNKAQAIAALQQINLQLQQLPQDAKLSIIDHGAPAQILADSSLLRELMYNHEHCIHHLAIIGMCVRSAFAHIPLPKDFGKAYSTIRYEMSIVCAR